MQNNYLEKINSPNDVKDIPEKDIPILCQQIRDFLVENVEKTGGHLASNLGVTEMSVAIHRVFDSPRDHIIFDVGHQSYVHKILTGRRESFGELRKTGGLSGFTSMKESEHDAFGAGHSSTSISAAIGFAAADKLSGSDSYTVAVLGDGAFTGGMAHEALNNCDPDSKLIIILNENGMSISVNKGRFAGYLSRVRISKGYRRWKKGTTAVINAIPLIGKPLKSFVTYVKTKIKNLIFSSNYFEDLGLYYIGAIDGNNYKKVENALREAKELSKCVIVHIKTKKGKGYEPAEKEPDIFHSVYCNNSSTEARFPEVFSEKLVSLADADEKIAAVTAAMGKGTSLDKFGEKYPERYFDVGIAEAHALTFSAGLAANGMKPFAAIYSTFLQRGYDSIIHDIALQDLPVKIMVDRASLAESDGATHHGIFDVSFLSAIPNMTILAPASAESLKAAVQEAYESNSPIAVRYANTIESSEAKSRFFKNEAAMCLSMKKDFDIGECKYVLITYGSLITRVMEAQKLLSARGIRAGIILIEKIKPYNDGAKTLSEWLCGTEKAVFAEEGIKNGGAAMIYREELLKLGFDFSKTKYEIAAIDDGFAAPDSPCDLYDYVGLSPEKLAEHFL